MDKKDKLITIFGVLVLIGASIGVYIWNPPGEMESEKLGIKDFYDVSSDFSNLPSGIVVPDNNPYYALIATPLAVHYNKNAEQHVVPLYVENYENPSSAVTRAIDMIGIDTNLIFKDTISAKNLSIDIAKGFWKNTDAVLIIEDTQSGYNLGVVATPLASYLSIPVIVVDELDKDVKNVLKGLGVKKSIVCGGVQGFGKVLRFDCVDEIVNASIDLVREMFGDVTYITLTNPIDVREPEVLDRVIKPLGPKKLKTISSMQLISFIKTAIQNKGNINFEIGKFTIPKDYKYALVKFEGVNLNPEHVDLLGDHVGFKVEGLLSGDTTHSPSVYDSTGNTLIDKYYAETVLYDMGGTEYTVTASPQWVVKKEGEVKATVTIEKLSDPLYPMMKGLSSVAPYLTAYHRGIIFGKPEFAFVADDNVLTEKAETCPGRYMPRSNEKLRGPSNDHIYNNIHLPLNKLLAKLADIPVENPKDVKYLRDYYLKNPVYIALVGGATVLPQYIYEAVVGYGGTPTDVLYGNIDPIPGWENVQDDVCSDYPTQENIVGRITGWDVQDASALVTRTIFYDRIIDGLGDWKDKATVQTGCGVEFATPIVLYTLARELGNTDHVASGYEEPLKWPTGYSKFVGDALQKTALEPMGFKTTRDTYFKASRTGLSNEAINVLKKANLLNLLLLSKLQLKLFIGEDRVTGGKDQENSNFIFINGHGDKPGYGIGDVALAGLGLGYVFLPILLQIIARISKPYGPGASLGALTSYNVRGVENMNFGPSFKWFESCLVGAIEGRHPKTCISQAFLHAGMNAIVVSPTPTSVAGGYLEPYNPKSTVLGTIRGFISTTLKAIKGIYPEAHFGEKMYEDMLEELKEKDISVGLALRNAKNRYLPEDADYEMYWSPPLGLLRNEDTKTAAIENKYVCYQEYCLYGDPAFNPYEPCNSG